MNSIVPIEKQPSGFALAPRNIDEAMRLADMICKSELAPKAFKGKPEDTLIAMMMGNEVGLNPLQAIQNIAVINGRPSIWGDAMLALVQNHPKFGGITESFDKGSMTATCTVWRKGGEKHTQTFSMEDAKKAGLSGKQGPWTQYPERMLSMRARGFALRNQFADALAGLISREEAMDTPIDAEYSEPSPAIDHKQPETLPVYDAKRFEANFAKYSKAIADGSSTAEDIINLISTRYEMTDDQKLAFRDYENDVKAQEQQQ